MAENLTYLANIRTQNLIFGAASLFGAVEIPESELVLVLIILLVFRLIRDSSRVRLSEIATGLTSTNLPLSLSICIFML
jgi:hypothetical protein